MLGLEDLMVGKKPALQTITLTQASWFPLEGGGDVTHTDSSEALSDLTGLGGHDSCCVQ